MENEETALIQHESATGKTNIEESQTENHKDIKIINYKDNILNNKKANFWNKYSKDENCIGRFLYEKFIKFEDQICWAPYSDKNLVFKWDFQKKTFDSSNYDDSLSLGQPPKELIQKTIEDLENHVPNYDPTSFKSERKNLWQIPILGLISFFIGIILVIIVNHIDPRNIISPGYFWSDMATQNQARRRTQLILQTFTLPFLIGIIIATCYFRKIPEYKFSQREWKIKEILFFKNTEKVFRRSNWVWNVGPMGSYIEVLINDDF